MSSHGSVSVCQILAVCICLTASQVRPRQTPCCLLVSDSMQSAAVCRALASCTS